MLGIYGGRGGESFQLRWIEMTSEGGLRRSQGSSLGPKYKQTSETAWPGVFQSYLYFAGSPFRSKLSPTAPLWHHTCTLPLFVGANNEALWQAFLSFLAGLGFLQRWTATVEESTNAQEVDASISALTCSWRAQKRNSSTVVAYLTVIYNGFGGGVSHPILRIQSY